MPTASVPKLEKQASLDANEPLRQGIVIIEHKIRNLEKRKARLDGYRDYQKSGKDLKADQLEAVSKYDAVLCHLELARELSKQLQTLANDSAKTAKKQARKEAAERAAQDLARTKDMMLITDVLASMGNLTVRDDLLNGKSKVRVTQQEMQAIDDLYEELTPKKDEPSIYVDLFQTPAETMHHLMEGKPKEAFKTTYSALKAKLLEIANSGYFDTIASAPDVPEVPLKPEPELEVEEPVQEVPVAPVVEPVAQIPNQVPLPQHQPIISHTFQPTDKGQPMAPVHPADVDSSIVTAIPAQPMPNLPPQPIETAYFTPSHLRVFQSGTIDFMQENELDTPENTETPSSAIPTMTFANQSFSSNEPQIAHLPPTTHIDLQQQFQNVSKATDEEKGWTTPSGPPLEREPPVPPQPMNAWSSLPAEQVAPTPNIGGRGEDDWGSQTEQWSQNQVNAAVSNDGFITAGSGRGRGSRGRGGGDRNNRGGYGGGNRGSGPRSSQGGSRGGGGYRGVDGGFIRDRDGGFSRDRGDREGGYNRDREGLRDSYKDQNSTGGGTGYQNGFQTGRSDRPGRGAPRQSQDRQERGGGRGGGNRRGGGGYRGANPTNFRPAQ